MENSNEQILGPWNTETSNTDDIISMTMTNIVDDFGADAHSDFVSSSRKLIEATRSKLMLMNGISKELRYLAGQIKDDRRENKNENSTGHKKHSEGETNSTAKRRDSKSDKRQQNIKIVVPVCTDDASENDVRKDARKTPPKPTVKSRYYRRTPRKKVERDSSLADLARKFCKKNKKSSKLDDPLKYLEDVQSIKKTDSGKNSKPEVSDTDRSDKNTRQGIDDASDDAVSSSDDKTPRESLLPVIKITRKSDRTVLTNTDDKKYSSREKRTLAKCHNCVAQAWCEKQGNKPPTQNAETQLSLRNGSFKKTYLKLCQRQICTRHSVPECNISTIQFETKTEIRQTNGLLSPLSRRIHTTAVPVRSGILTGKLRHLTSGFFQSEIIKSKEQMPMALTPEKHAYPKLLSFGSERINSEYLTHRRILRPSKVTLQASDSSEVGFLPLDEISVGFRFKLGKKQTFPVNQWSGRLNYGQIDELTLQKSRTHYDTFRT